MQYKIEDKLEILIPTYNRKLLLEHTLNSLLAKDSPVRLCQITVLDNATDDGSKELIAGFASKYSNVKHIRHKTNIGGNANITRAYELAQKEYVWVVCDDDSFRWDSWCEIEQAIYTGDYDLLLTRKNDLKGTSNIAKIFRQCTFVPAAIYRTAIINSNVLVNMYNNIPFLFPHLAIISEVFNRKGRIFLPQGEIMDKCSFNFREPGQEYRTPKTNLYYPEMARKMFWTVGFIHSVQMIKDPKLRIYILDNLGRHGFLGYIVGAFRKNYTTYKGYKLNKDLIADGLCFRHRMKFYCACLFLKVTSMFRRKSKK